MNKAFMIQGNTVSEINPNFAVESKIPVGVYDICITRMGIHLEKISDEFVFPYKIYGLQTNFIDHIIKTYNNTDGNMGILMNGIKGTGKTVSAKILANKLQLPIIILKNIGENTSIAIDYVSTLACDCIIFMDEFEKNFSEGHQEILQMMDGVYNSEYRKVFLLTTNELNINENLLGRPSRIRYVKEFGNLDKETVEEYLNENLHDLSAKQTIIEFIDTLTISTIDILKSIVTEVNIHGIDKFTEYREFFNVTTESYMYTTYRGKVYVKELSENREKFTIKNFVSQLEQYLNPPVVVNEVKEQTPITRLNNDFHGFCWISVESNKKFTQLKPGDEFYEYPIVEVDIESRTIITYNEYDNCYNFYFINNPEVSPSLYNKKKSFFSI
jgi:broad-specificity NMP kinase